MTFEDVKTRFDNLKAAPRTTVSTGKQGAIIGLLDKACGSKENRYQFAIALGLPPHSKDWTAGEWYAVSQIVKADKPIDKWIATEPKFDSIIGAVMAKVNNQAGQVPMFEVAE